MAIIRNNHTRHRLKIETRQLNRFLEQQAPDVRVSQVRYRQKKGQQSTEFNLVTSLASGLEFIQVLQADFRRFFRGFQLGLEPISQGNGYKLKADRSIPVEFLELISTACPEVLPPQTAVLGWASGEVPVLLNLAAPDNYHLLLSGVEQSGKTSLLRSLMMSLALLNRPSRTQFIIASADGDRPGGRANFDRFRYIPHLLMPILADRRAFAEAVDFLDEELRYRIEVGIAFPEIYLVVDDLQDFLHTNDQALVARLAALARLGKNTGLHLILSTRFPDHPVLYDLLEADLPNRITGRAASLEQAEIATGLIDSGAERLFGRGDFLAAVNEELIYFQGAFLDEADLHYCLEHLYQERPPALIAREFNPRPVLPGVPREDTLIFEEPQPDWVVVRKIDWPAEQFVKITPESWPDCPLRDIVHTRGNRQEPDEAKGGAESLALPEHTKDSGGLPSVRVKNSAREETVLVFSPNSRGSFQNDTSEPSDISPSLPENPTLPRITDPSATVKSVQPHFDGLTKSDMGEQAKAPTAAESDPWVSALVDPVVDPISGKPKETQAGSSDLASRTHLAHDDRSRVDRPWEKSTAQGQTVEDYVRRLSKPEANLKIKTRLDRQPADEDLLEEAAPIRGDLDEIENREVESDCDFPELEYEPFDD